MKVASINLGGYTNWRDRIHLVADYLDKERPDVIFLQEVRFDIGWTEPNQATELNKHLESPFIYETSSISRFYRPSTGDPYKEGLAILSRVPILKSETLALTQAVDDKHVRLIQNADILWEGQSVLVSNIHLSNNKYSSVQLGELMGILSKRDEKRIIAGDFNIFDITQHKELYRGYVASVEFSDYVSFPSEGKTIDYMLLPDEYSYQDITSTEGLSDHAALSYVINLAANEGNN